MQYTDNEAALIGGLISNYFFQPSVDAKLRESYRRVLRHLHENTLSESDLSRIQNALTFLSPLCRDTREAGNVNTMAHTLGMSIQQHQQKSLLKFYILPRTKRAAFPKKLRKSGPKSRA